MTDDESPAADWDPHGPEVDRDQRAAYDAMRARCPVAHGADGGWTVLGHAEVVRVLHDHETFSNVVSSHPSVPNGMDPPAHEIWRRVLDPCFSPARIAAFEPACRQVATALATAAGGVGTVEVMSAVALPFAAEVQCAYLGWPRSLATTLVDWAERNHAATRAGDRAAGDAIATDFGQIVAGLLRARGSDEPADAVDLTEALMRTTVQGRPLTVDQLISILRNWTMGEVGTIGASVGIVAHFLAHSPEVQRHVRRGSIPVPEAIDEILRLHGPLVSNRRTTTRRVDIGGRTLDPGARVSINWVAANRDPEAFPSADQFQLGRNPADNLLYGAGIHACPGAGLARLELQAMTEALLAATSAIEPLADRPATLAAPPAGGFATVPLRLTRAVS